MLSAPTSTAPWASRRAMMVASCVAGARSRLIFEPARVDSPAMSNKFLTANGTPASAPSRRPRARSASIAAALASARSAVTAVNALRTRSCLAIRVSAARTTAAALVRPSQPAAAISLARAQGVCVGPGAEAEKIGAGSASSGSGKSANRAANASVTSRLVLTALFQAGSSLRSSACAAASTKLSRRSRLGGLRFTRLPLARDAFATGARDGLNFPLRNDLACFVIASCSDAFLRSMSSSTSRHSFPRRREFNLKSPQPGSPQRGPRDASIAGWPARGRAEWIVLHPLRERRVGNGGQEVASILRLRRNQNLFGRPLLDDASRLHDDDTIAQQPQHVEVVGDEQVAHPQRVLELLQQIEHDRLHRHVERRRRFVEDDEIGAERDRPRDAYARLLSAGQLMRKAVEQLERQADLAGKRFAARAHRRASLHVAQPQDRVGDGARGGEARIEAVGRILEHHLDALA